MTEYDLSKSQYCRGKHCLKSIWLYKHRRELAEAPSDFKSILFRQGHEVGELAQKYFPNGELIHEGITEIQQAIDHTNHALNSNIRTLFEAAFLHDQILIRADVVTVNDDRSLNLIEVKSTNSVKNHHIDDVAVQKYVLENCGLKVKSCFLMHLNSGYRRDGEVSIVDLFKLVPVNSDVSRRSGMIDITIKRIRATVAQPTEPNIDIGTHCTSPYDCDFQGHCWSQIGTDSIHNLTRINEDKRKTLVSMGIARIQEIPEDKVKLSADQLVQKRAATEQRAIIDFDKIGSFLAELKYPLYFFDFESVSYAIPPYDDVCPYMHLPFQYSLHIQDLKNGELKHKDFIHDQATDPRRFIAERMCQDIPNDGGSVIVYHAKYERSRIDELASLFPDLEDRLRDINSRLWDLETPFANRWYCHWKFGKSSSIKVVLPTLCPELSYKDLAIQDGGTASMKYGEMIKAANRETLKNDLLAYCKLDTYAMYAILNHLLNLKVGR